MAVTPALACATDRRFRGLRGRDRVCARLPSCCERGKRSTHSNVRDGKRLVWYADRLWRLAADLPVVEVELESVKAWTGAGALDEDCWFVGARVPTLREVARHCQRINVATFDHPIILNDDGSLMDAGHRLCKALVEGRATISTARFPSMPPPDEVLDLVRG